MHTIMPAKFIRVDRKEERTSLIYAYIEVRNVYNADVSESVKMSECTLSVADQRRARCARG